MNVAVVGCGVMGNIHSRIYNSLKKVKLAAVCDIDPKAARKIGKLYKTKFYQNHLDLLSQNHIDAASIAVPTKDHLRVALDFIERKIPILIEKPIASSSKEAKLIIKAANRNNVFVTTGHIERFNPAVIKLKELLSSNAFGKILSVNIKRVGLFPPRIKDVNILVDLAIHDLDIVSMLLNELPDHVYAKGSGALTNGRLDHAEIFLDFKKFGCFIQANWVTPIKIRQLSITGTKGYAELNYVTQELLVYKSNYEITEVTSFNEFVIKFGKAKFKKINIINQEPLLLEIKNFINVINHDAKPKITLNDALRAIYMAEMVEKSIRTNKVIPIYG